MSNHLALATVTAALAHQIQTAFHNDDPGVMGAEVSTRTPSEAGMPQVGANVFLFQVTPNAAWRNADLPTRDSGARLVHRPCAAVDAHYLLTFYGDERRLEPQRLLGSSVRALHAEAVLTRDAIAATITANADSDFLPNSDLADSIELVKFTPIALSLEELSKVWSVFFQIPYTLSIAYKATVVLIETDGEPRRPLPVRERTVTVLPFRTPVIESVEPERVVVGSELTVRGSNLAGEVTRVRVGDQTVTPTAVSARSITFLLPETLAAGVHAVQVVHRLSLGDPPTQHRGFESNVAPFMLLPTITTSAPISVAAGEMLTLDVSPPAGRRQRVAVLIGQHAIRRHVERTTSEGEPVVEPETIPQPQFHIPDDIETGTYLLRVRIDGADSPLTTDETGQSDGPMVMIT